MIGEYLEEFTADFREHFHCALTDIGSRVSWTDAVLFGRALARDGATRVGAALRQWRWPASRESLTLADLYDVTLAANSTKRRKGDRYPRPWGDKRESRSRAPEVSQEVIRAALKARGH